MSEFENLIVCLLIPGVYIMTYIAGKYDILTLICKRLEERVQELAEPKPETEDLEDNE